MPAQQQQEQDSGLGPFWVSLAVIITLLVVWYLYSQYLVWALFQVRLAEAYLMSFFTSSLNHTIAWMHQVPLKSVTFEQVQYVSTEIGDYYRIPVAVILAAFSMVIYFSSSTSRFKQTYSMTSLLGAEKDERPFVAPVTDLNLVDTPLSEGPWAMAMSPLAFSEHHHLLKTDHIERQRQSAKLGQKVIPVAKIRRGDAIRVFSLQLGSYYRGPEVLPIHTRALFAVFAARAAHDIASATRLLEQIAASTKTKQLDFSGTDELLQKYRKIRTVVKLSERHAYITTAMATMLVEARKDGVLATSDFLWLKPIDRRLWYVLNTIGRQTAFTEVAGVISHWLAEKEIGHALFTPMVNEAVKGLEDTISNILYEKEERGDEFIVEGDE